MAHLTIRRGMLMIFEHDVAFHIGRLAVTETVVATWALVVFLGAVGAVAGSHFRADSSSGWQTLLEWGISSIERVIGEVTGGSGQPYLPLVATIGAFVLFANTMSVLPGIEAPTADLNTPLALAAIVFVSVHYFGVRQLGWRTYLATFAKPSPLMLPMNLLSHLTRTFSLAMRLFGNMLSHQVIVAVLLVVLPLVVPAVLEVFGLLIGVLQAYIFTILTIVYIGGAVRAEGEAG